MLEKDVIAEIENPSEKMSVKHNKIGISDYIADGGEDIEHISDYFEKKPYTFDDVLALFWLSEKSEDKEVFISIAQSMLSNESGLPLIHTRKLFERNVNELKEYSYCFASLDDVSFENNIYIRLNAKNYLEISQRGMRYFDISPEEEWDYSKFIENNYSCSIGEIDEALECFEAYFERGRTKCTSPFVLRFQDYSNFINSLYFVEYEDIFDNENYLIAMGEDKVEVSENANVMAIDRFTQWLAGNRVDVVKYNPKVDLAFFFDERVRIGQVYCAGMADHMRSLSFFAEIGEKNNLDIYYNDLIFDRLFWFAGVDGAVVTTVDIENKRLSNIFSKKLRQRIKSKKLINTWPLDVDSLWHELGLKEAYIVLYQKSRREHLIKYLDREDPMPVLVCIEAEMYKDFIVNKSPNKVAICVGTAQSDAAAHKPLYEKHFTFPGILPEDAKNYETIQICKQTDAIAVHIRRGDYLTAAQFSQEWRFNIDYKKALEMVYKEEPFTKYTNKHLLVFSDDMEWAKANAENLGLCVAGENITYVDWNHQFNSYKDMQLISLCKVIIRGNGKFAWTAGLMSSDVDYIVAVTDKRVWIPWQRDMAEEA